MILSASRCLVTRMRNIFAILLLLFATLVSAQAQTHVFPATDTNNNFTGTNRFTAGHTDGPVTFGSLPAELDGLTIFCSDCSQTIPCAAFGTGAVATGVAGAWSCSNGGAPLTGVYSGAVSSTAGHATIGFATVSGSAVPEFSWNTGAPQILAFLNSDTTGTATTALGAKNTPTLCSGSVSRGVDASFNAVCSTPGVLTITETTGIVALAANLNLWGDSVTHYPMFNENSGATLSVNGPYAAAWAIGNVWGSATTIVPSVVANKMRIWGVTLPFRKTLTKIYYDVGTVDNTANTYDIGLMDRSCNLIAHCGATAGTTFAPSTGTKNCTVVGSPVVLQIADYYLAITTSCGASCAAFSGSSGNGQWSFYNAIADQPVTAGGTLNGGCTPPTDAPSRGAVVPMVLLQ